MTTFICRNAGLLTEDWEDISEARSLLGCECECEDCSNYAEYEEVEAMENSTSFLDSQLAKDIWEKKYQYNGESVDEWFERVSGGDKDIERLMREGKFLFGGRILSNRGLDKRGVKCTYSNCYVLTTGDSIEDIYKTHSKLARTFSYGGGVGIDISPLRPRGTKVNNTAKETTGAVSFMPSFSQVSEIIGQNGRRGALMISMSCSHPDIEEFIEAKQNDDKITGANISVRVDKEFMEAVKTGKSYECSFALEDGRVILKEVDARKLFYKLAQNNYDWAEPGILFWDRITNYNLLSEDEEFTLAGVNPCAEEPLPDGGSCLLGAFNLSAYVDKGGNFDFREFKRDIPVVVEAMNEVLDEGLPLHPLQIQRDTVRDWRQIGIGIMGLADMLIKMGIRYGSQESFEICDKIGDTLARESMIASSKLASYTGESYPKCKPDKILESQFFKAHEDNYLRAMIKEYGLKNSQLLTIAPTGTISNLLGVSGGVEPIFSYEYMRKTESLHGEDRYYKVVTPVVKEYMDKHNISSYDELPDYFVKTENLNPVDRIGMQAVWQRHIDASISSTLNLPKETSVEKVAQLYMLAWEEGLKGLTIYRAGCKREGILTSTDNTEDTAEEVQEITLGLGRGEIDNVDISDCLAKGRRLQTGCGTLWVTAYFTQDTGELRHIFLDKGSKGGCNSFMCGLSRMISISARAGVPIDKIADQLKSTVTCNSYLRRTILSKDTSRGGSCPSAIGEALLEMSSEIRKQLAKVTLSNVILGENPIELVELRELNNEGKEVLKINDNELESSIPCPECGQPLRMTEGCMSCSCGYSKC